MGDFVHGGPSWSLLVILSLLPFSFARPATLMGVCHPGPLELFVSSLPLCPMSASALLQGGLMEALEEEQEWMELKREGEAGQTPLPPRGSLRPGEAGEGQSWRLGEREGLK